MEDIIVSLLFVYPGAAIELFYRWRAKYSYKEEARSEPIMLAELFIQSAIVTVLTILSMQFFTGLQIGSLSMLIIHLNHFRTMSQYLILSVVMTALVGWLRYKIAGMGPDEAGIGDREINGCRVVSSVNAWRELMFGNDLANILEHCIVRISCGGESVAGFVTCFPTDFEKGISLTQTDFVETQLKREECWEPEQRNIGSPHTVYIDPVTGSKVEFFDGAELYNYLNQPEE